MKVLYIAKHGLHDNCDEDAIGWALERLGCVVRRVEESRAARKLDIMRAFRPDFTLFHKWDDYHTMAAAPGPKFFWYFDLVANRDDPSLAARMESRRRWMEAVTPLCVTGFCTDGDWCYETGAIHLTQGFDERIKSCPPRPLTVPILFTGLVKHGLRRESHIAHLRERWGDKFRIIGDGGPHRRVHRADMAELLASAVVAVAPSGPDTNAYWSNRVYNTLGLGGFLLHPHCEGLRAQYGPQELLTYRTWEECDDAIDFTLRSERSVRDYFAERGREATLARHTYRHRCEVLLKEVRRLCGL